MISRGDFEPDIFYDLCNPDKEDNFYETMLSKIFAVNAEVEKTV